ncbi:hypothetical protein O5D80_002643 [Batrachochytrium dendrobatidis]|nr:hypothetical protein O5D80_002643 [Batrachochytrium dendrobatidis]
MPKRFLNVEYDTLTAEIDVTDFEDLSDIQDAIKSEQPTQTDLFAAGSTLTAGYKKRRTSEWEKVSTLAQLSYDPNLTIFKLDTNYLAKTGLSTQKLILYCRPTFHEQFSFLREKVIDNGVLGWILGPPGTDRYPVCVRLEGDSKKSQEIYDSNIDKLFDILHKVDESKQHIVFIDGYTSNGQKHIDVQQACYSWLEEDREKRRLEEEYIHAVQNDEFFNHVKAVLDSDLQIDSSREDLVRSKLYFAGASARCMFLFATKDVIQQTYGLVTFVNDIFPYVKGTIGDQSNNVVDRLFSSSLVENDVCWNIQTDTLKR